MKIISIEIEETSRIAPYIEKMVRTKPLNISASFEGMPIVDLDETYKRETYPTQVFAINNNFERYYIRERDKDAFEALVSGFIKEAQRGTLRTIEEFLIENPSGKGLPDLIKALKDKLE